MAYEDKNSVKPTSEHWFSYLADYAATPPPPGPVEEQRS